MEHRVFAEQFDFRLPALVNLVGGGGKTGLILALMDEFYESGSVLYTTTTRIHPPQISDGLAIIACSNPDHLKVLLARIGQQRYARTYKYVGTRLPTTPGLLQGVPPDLGQMLDQEHFPLILNEADGTKSMSLKMPREGEPVLMHGANYLVPVIGLDCLNKPLGPETIFRWEIASARLPLKSGQTLTAELAASILMHHDGVCKDWKRSMHIIPFINKADTTADDSLALDLAHALLGNQNFPVDRVVWGSVHTKRAASVSAHIM